MFLGIIHFAYIRKRKEKYMKTAKQIYLRMEEKGKELLSQIEPLDKIIVTEDTLRKIFKGQEAKKVNT